MNRIFLLMGALLCAPALVEAQLQLNLDKLAARASESADVSLDGATLKLAGQFLSARKPDEAEAKKLVEGLKGVYVRTYKFAKPEMYSQSDLEPLREQVRKPGWTKIVGTQKKGESSEIYTKTENGQITGLAIITAAPKELTVVYIDGTIDLGRLSGLGGQFGIPAGAIPDVAKKPK